MSHCGGACFNSIVCWRCGSYSCKLQARTCGGTIMLSNLESRFRHNIPNRELPIWCCSEQICKKPEELMRWHPTSSVQIIADNTHEFSKIKLDCAANVWLVAQSRQASCNHGEDHLVVEHRDRGNIETCCTRPKSPAVVANTYQYLNISIQDINCHIH